MQMLMSGGGIGSSEKSWGHPIPSLPTRYWVLEGGLWYFVLGSSVKSAHPWDFIVKGNIFKKYHTTHPIHIWTVRFIPSPYMVLDIVKCPWDKIYFWTNYCNPCIYWIISLAWCYFHPHFVHLYLQHLQGYWPYIWRHSAFSLDTVIIIIAKNILS